MGAFALVGGGAAAAELTDRAGPAGADQRPVPTPRGMLRSRDGARVVQGVQQFRSRPDLRPPQVTIDVPHRGDLGGLVVTEIHAGASQSGPLLIDGNGRIVWFLPLSPQPSAAHRAFNVQVQTYRGKPVLCWFQGGLDGNHGKGHYELYDTSYRRIAQVFAGNGYYGDLHEFLLTDRGTALFTCYGTDVGDVTVGGRQYNNLTYTYGVVQEVDVASGKVLFQWRSDEHVGLDASYEPMAPAGSVWDYFHINGIAIDPADQNLLISSRNTWTVFKVDRTTGQVIWKLGGKDSDFQIGAGAHFAFQHHVNMHPGGLLTVFDNEGGPPQEASQSRALVLNYDENAKTVSLKRQYLHRPAVYSDALGSVQLLEDGGVFVGWGRSTYFTQYGPTGQVEFDGHLTQAGGASSYRAFKQDWAGMPHTRPDVATRRRGAGALVYVSWNGATEVSRWEVLAGASAHRLESLGKASVVGFETEIELPQRPGWVAVRALASNGRTLATSRTLRV